MTAPSFAGLGTALVTPFTPGGELDEPALRRPIPVKASLAMMGLCEESFLFPLVSASEATRELLRRALRGLGLL